MALPSAKYAQYEKAARFYIPHHIQLYNGYGSTIDIPVNIKCLFYMPTRRLCDLTNLLEAIDDVLVKYGLLKDDNFNIVAGHDGSRVRLDKENPRTEITITTMEVADEVL